MRPIVESDFIFSAIAEEMGLFGGAAIVPVPALPCAASAATRSRKVRFICLCSSWPYERLAFQTFLIVAGVTKLML